MQTGFCNLVCFARLQYHEEKDDVHESRVSMLSRISMESIRGGQSDPNNQAVDCFPTPVLWQGLREGAVLERLVCSYMDKYITNISQCNYSPVFIDSSVIQAI